MAATEQGLQAQVVHGLGLGVIVSGESESRRYLQSIVLAGARHASRVAHKLVLVRYLVVAANLTSDMSFKSVSDLPSESVSAMRRENIEGLCKG